MALQKAIKSGNTTSFKFKEEGDTIKGYYQGQVEKNINGSPAIEHTYKTKDGTLSVLGQANILNQLKANNITPGTYVEIVFSGEMLKLKGNRTMKVYDISFDPDNQDLDVSTPTSEGWSEEDGTGFEEPAVSSKAPSAQAQARIQALLSKGKTTSTRSA
jgi:hypothetical protein